MQCGEEAMSVECSSIGIEQFLNEIDDKTLHSLATTVTQGLSKNKINNRQEAISIVMNYSSSPASILNRKIITRDILFSYCTKNCISLVLPATKISLIEQILAYWATLEPKPNTISTNTENDSQIIQLAYQFCEWFYSIMNSDNCFDSSHLFPDSRLKITIITNNSTNYQSELFENDPDRIAQELYSIKTKWGIFFNPNLSDEGLKGRIEPHGLVMVSVCGTLHSNNECVGVFEQTFGLIRDPAAENRWKIRFTELNLKNVSGSGAPCPKLLIGGALPPAFS